MNIKSDLQFWCALCIMYRCLLRVSHIVASPHTMRRKDIVFTATGVDVIIRSSKTVQYRERTVTVPVVAAPGSILCPCSYLKYYTDRVGLRPDDPLFPYSYNSLNNRL